MGMHYLVVSILIPVVCYVVPWIVSAVKAYLNFHKLKASLKSAEDLIGHDILRPAPSSWTDLMAGWMQKPIGNGLRRAWPYTNLVLQGGGSKAIAEVAACIELEHRGLFKSLTRFGGSSAGAIVASLFAAGLAPEKVGQIIMDMPFPAFFDRSNYLFANIRQLIAWPFGWFDGQVIEDFMQKVYSEACGVRFETPVTFKMLHQKTGFTLVVTACNLERDNGVPVYFSHLTSPDMKVAKAVLASSCFPGVWKSVVIGGELHVDGGTQSNLPNHIFNGPVPSEENRMLPQSEQTLSIRLFDQRIARPGTATLYRNHTKINNFVQFIMAVINAQGTQLDRCSINGRYWHNTIACDTMGISALDLSLTDKQKLELLHSGREGTVKFLEHF